MARRTKKSSTRSSNRENGKQVETKETSISEKDGKEEVTNSTKVPPKNDVEWYVQDEQLGADVARIPFNVPHGGELDLLDAGIAFPASGGSLTTNAHSHKQSSGGVCSLRIKPTIGLADNMTDPANVAANSLYSFVRYVNSGRKNYDPSDLFMYVHTMADCYSFILWCKRLYAYAFMYSQRNWFIGDCMLKANGVDPAGLKLNLANFRAWLNSFINRVSSWAVPATIYYFKRRAFMFANYYIENNYGNIKDQLYQFVPDGWYHFDLDAQGLGMLKYDRWAFDPSTLAQWTDIVTYGENMIANITGDEDFGLMSGDIIKAFGSNIITLGSQEDDAGLVPVFDIYVLSQFKNANIINIDLAATFTHKGNTYKSGDIYQDANGILFSSNYSYNTISSELVGRMNQILSSENPDPGIGDVFEATRLKTAMPHAAYNAVTCGSEICVYAYFDLFRNNAEIFVPLSSNTYLIPHGKVTTPGYEGDLGYNISIISQWKYAPIMYTIVIDSTDNTDKKIDGVFNASNVDNTALINTEQIERLHQVALLSMLFVPGVAKQVNRLS